MVPSLPDQTPYCNPQWGKPGWTRVSNQGWPQLTIATCCCRSWAGPLPIQKVKSATDYQDQEKWIQPWLQHSSGSCLWSINVVPKTMRGGPRQGFSQLSQFSRFSQKSDPKLHSIIGELTLNIDSLIHRNREKKMKIQVLNSRPWYKLFPLGQLASSVSWLLVHQHHSLECF